MQWIYPGDMLLTSCNAAVSRFGFKADYFNGYFPSSTQVLDLHRQAQSQHVSVTSAILPDPTEYRLWGQP